MDSQKFPSCKKFRKGNIWKSIFSQVILRFLEYKFYNLNIFNIFQRKRKSYAYGVESNGKKENLIDVIGGIDSKGN